MPATAPAARPRYTAHRAALLAVFALVLFLRLWLVREWGSPIPYWDQWDGEALQLYRPWLDGTFRWTTLFSAHNEHRIVLTRVIDLALLVGTGHWETWWQLIINAALNAAAAALLVATFWSPLALRARALFIGVVAVLFTTPSGWQNALWGFQSQCYLVNGLTCLAIACMLTADPLRPRWWLGWGAALLAPFAQGSGVFAAIAVGVVAATTTLHSPPPRQRTWLALGALALIAALGFALRVEVPAHAYLQAKNCDQFFAVFSRCLAWPHIEQPLLCLLMEAPLLWLLTDLVRRRRPPTAAECCALALGLTGLLNAAGVAYSRGAGLPDNLPLSRYQDGLVLGTVANLFIVLGPLTRMRHHKVITLGWLGLVLLGVGVLAAGSLSLNLPFKALQNQTSQQMVESYRLTHDPGVFLKANLFLRPHPSAAPVVAVLDDPQLLPVLPPELRGETAPRPWPIEYAQWLAAASAAALAVCLRRGTAKPHVVSTEFASR